MQYLIDIGTKVVIEADSELEAIDIAANRVYYDVEGCIALIVNSAEEITDGHDI